MEKTIINYELQNPFCLLKIKINKKLTGGGYETT